MSEFHKKILDDLTKDWTIEQLDMYLDKLGEERVELSRWIAHVVSLRKKKVRKSALDNGVRGGT